MITKQKIPICISISDAKNLTTVQVDHTLIQTTESQVFTKMLTVTPKYDEITDHDEYNITDDSISNSSTNIEMSTTPDKATTKYIAPSTTGTSTILATSTTAKLISSNVADERTTYFNRYITTMRPCMYFQFKNLYILCHSH